ARAGAHTFSWILSPAAAFDRTTEVKRETGLAILRCLSQTPVRSSLQERAAERLRQWEAPPAKAPVRRSAAGHAGYPLQRRRLAGRARVADRPRPGSPRAHHSPGWPRSLDLPFARPMDPGR